MDDRTLRNHVPPPPQRDLLPPASDRLLMEYVWRKHAHLHPLMTREEAFADPLVGRVLRLHIGVIQRDERRPTR